MQRDSWLFSDQKEIRKSRRGGKVLDAASDHAFRMLAGDGPRITNWGGTKSEDGRVAVMKKGGTKDQQWPDSRQLRDPFTTFYVQGIALEPPLPPDRMLNLTEENPLHGGCLMAKATDACGRGWKFAPTEEKKGDESLVQSDLPGKLKAAVNDLTPELTFSELLYQAAWEMDAIGWGVWEVVRVIEGDSPTPGKYGKIGAIYPVPAHTIRATLDPRKWVQIRAGRVRYFKKFGAKCEINNETGTVLEWEKDDAGIQNMDAAYVASEIIIFKNYTPRSLWYGVPRWVSGIATIAEMTAIREFNVSWFASGGQTDFSMHMKAESLEVAKAMLEQVQTQMRENAGRGHQYVLTAGTADTDVKVAALGELLREGHFRFRRQDLAKEVLIAHNVPPYRIGWAETGSLAGNAADEMLEAYKFGAIKPIQIVIEERLHQTLFDPRMGIKTDEFRLKLHDLNMDQIKTEIDLATKGVQFGFLTPNQAKHQVGLDPDPNKPELDAYYYQGQPLGQAQGAGGATGQPFGGGDGTASGQPFGPMGGDEFKAAVKAAVVEAMSGLESVLKDAVAEKDAIEPDEVDGRPRRGGKKGPGPSLAGPARGDKLSGVPGA